MKSDTCLTPYKNINSKCIKDLTRKPETMKLLRGNIGENLQDIFLANDTDTTPKAEVTKAKLNRWDHTKLTRFCTAKGIIQ